MKTRAHLRCVLLSVFLAAAPLSGSARGQQAFDQGGAPPDALLLCAGHVETKASTRDPLESLCRPGAGRAVIRIDGPMTPGRRESLKQAGATVVSFIPRSAFVVDLSNADAQALAQLDWIRWHAAYKANWKIDPAIGKTTFQKPERKAIESRGEMVASIHTFANATVEEVRALRDALARAGAETYESEVVRGSTVITARVSRDRLEALAGLDGVQYIENAPEITFRRNSTVRGVIQSNSAGLTPIYDQGLHGEGQIIGIMDGRVDVNHCSFFDNAPIGPAHRKIEAYNTSTANPDFHGTHVAGTALGEQSPPVNDDTRGVAYAARMVFSREPSFTEPAMYQKLALHHSQGARIHTNSWGNDLTETYDGLCRAIDAFSYDHEDDLVIFAASNDTVLHNPENAKNCLAVGATQQAPNQEFHETGGLGPTSDGRRKPEIYAPGQNTLSAQSGTPCGTLGLTGTSMAAPAIAGAAALVRQYFTEGFYPTGSPTPADAMTPSGALMKAILLNAAQDMLGVAGYPSDLEGWGHLVLDDALFFASDSRDLWVKDVRNADGIATGTIIEETILNLATTEELRVTLVWTDPPGAPGTTHAPVNDLDLEVVAPGDLLYRGNVFSGGYSTSGGSGDPVNNVEQVRLANPPLGPWTVRVRGTAVNEGVQGYALVVTGEVVSDGQDLSITVLDPPDVLAPFAGENVQVRIDPGDDTLVKGTERAMFRLDSGDFEPIELTPVGGDLYEFALPPAVCGDDPQFYVEAEGVNTGLVQSPAPGSTEAYFEYDVGEAVETVVLQENFEGGLPAGWSAGGLWHVTGACVSSPTCDGASWAYYGQDGSCTYSTGSANSGVLLTGQIALPDADALRLEYCSRLVTENFAGVDETSVSVNGVPLRVPVSSLQAGWENKSIDLSAFAGQSVTLAWGFDTVDSFGNNFLGWQVDDVRIVATNIECDSGPACPGDVDGSGEVDIIDITYVIFRLGNTGTPGTVDGDADGNGAVETIDISFIVFRLGSCP